MKTKFIVGIFVNGNGNILCLDDKNDAFEYTVKCVQPMNYGSQGGFGLSEDKSSLSFINRENNTFTIADMKKHGFYRYKNFNFSLNKGETYELIDNKGNVLNTWTDIDSSQENSDKSILFGSCNCFIPGIWLNDEQVKRTQSENLNCFTHFLISNAHFHKL